ncbi:MAG TPA: CocE/NonD family hydrolase, partial [Cyclobacteriaceae bacterium]|nr:CocE/NonD family hydrolase [Cyclobacteriaceae bacterium]
MKKLLLLLAVVVVMTVHAQQSGPSPDEIYKKLESIAVIDQKVMMPMRDGVRLASDIYRPKGNGKAPTILSRTPYNFNTWVDGEMRTRALQDAYDAVRRGYAYVVQNERGRFFSEGTWDILGTPVTDGTDAIDWLSKQSWSNGKVGLIGCSSTAEWQMAVAAQGHPGLGAIVAQGFGAGVGRVGEFMEQGNWYRGGAHQMLFTAWLYGTQNDAFRPMFPKDITQSDLQRVQRFYDLATEMPKVDWAQGLSVLPVKDIMSKANGQKGGVFDQMIIRKPNDPAWFKGGLYHDNQPINVPGFWFVSWYDVSSSPNIALYNHVRKNPNKEMADNQYLIIAPVLHCSYKRATENTMVGERSMGDARLNYDDLTWAWFDMLLKGEKNDFKKNAHVKYFTMGKNVWQTSEVWPPANTVMTDYFLTSEGKANTRNGNGKLVSKVPSADKPDTFA